jgi:hypothetical protein
MRKLFFAIAAIIATLFSFSPVIAGGNFGDENLGPISECELREILGEPPCRRLTREEAFKTIEALGNIAGAAIVNDRNRYYRPAPRVRRYNNEGDWIYRTGGRRMSAGDYCGGRLQYDLSSGRYYCVR